MNDIDMNNLSEKYLNDSSSKPTSNDIYDVLNDEIPELQPSDPRCLFTITKKKRKELDLPVPRFKYDSYWVGPVPAKEVTFTNLNDNIDQRFLEDMCTKFGEIAEAKIYNHPKTRKHLGLGKVLFKLTKSAKDCVQALNQTTKMGTIMNVFLDTLGQERTRLFDQMTRDVNQKLSLTPVSSTGQLTTTTAATTITTPTAPTTQSDLMNKSDDEAPQSIDLRRNQSLESRIAALFKIDISNTNDVSDQSTPPPSSLLFTLYEQTSPSPKQTKIVNVSDIPLPPSPTSTPSPLSTSKKQQLNTSYTQQTDYTTTYMQNPYTMYYNYHHQYSHVAVPPPPPPPPTSSSTYTHVNQYVDEVQSTRDKKQEVDMVLNLIVSELKEIISKDLNKRMIENFSFKAIENWFVKEEAKSKILKFETKFKVESVPSKPTINLTPVTTPTAEPTFQYKSQPEVDMTVKTINSINTHIQEFEPQPYQNNHHYHHQQQQQTQKLPSFKRQRIPTPEPQPVIKQRDERYVNHSRRSRSRSRDNKQHHQRRRSHSYSSSRSHSRSRSRSRNYHHYHNNYRNYRDRYNNNNNNNNKSGSTTYRGRSRSRSRHYNNTHTTSTSKSYSAAKYQRNNYRESTPKRHRSDSRNNNNNNNKRKISSTSTSSSSYSSTSNTSSSSSTSTSSSRSRTSSDRRSHTRSSKSKSPSHAHKKQSSVKQETVKVAVLEDLWDVIVDNKNPNEKSQTVVDVVVEKKEEEILKPIENEKNEEQQQQLIKEELIDKTVINKKILNGHQHNHNNSGSKSGYSIWKPSTNTDTVNSVVVPKTKPYLEEDLMDIDTLQDENEEQEPKKAVVEELSEEQKKINRYFADQLWEEHCYAKTMPWLKNQEINDESVNTTTSALTNLDTNTTAAIAKTASKIKKQDRVSRELVGLFPILNEKATVNTVPVAPKVKYKPRVDTEELAILESYLINGLDQEDIQYLKHAYEQLTHINKCIRWTEHAATYIEPLVVSNTIKNKKCGLSPPHQTNSARTSGKYTKLSIDEKYKRLCSKKLATSGHHQPQKQPSETTTTTTNDTNNREARSLQRRLVASYGDTEFHEMFKFNQLKLRKKPLKFAKSDIHDWGLFALDNIVAEEFVIEYVGETVRQSVADNREKWYNKQGIGSSYMFRIDSDTIVDATKCGNLSRFINHSCDPNCYAKIITIEGKKKIVIYSRRDIRRGEEITYDYKFPIEDNKIPCFCGTSNCKGTLN